MKTRPIIFSGPMVRALLDGRKTMTRRVVKPQPNSGPGGEMVDLGGAWGLLDGDLSGEWVCPYGAPGDLRWVRETFAGQALRPLANGRLFYRADGDADGVQTALSYIKREPRWRPSIHMPRWASRITLRVTDVRVERVQDISEEDAVAEGVQIPAPYIGVNYEDGSAIESESIDMAPSDFFRDIWNTINGPDAWGRNDWVWVASFDVLKRNVDEVTANG